MKRQFEEDLSNYDKKQKRIKKNDSQNESSSQIIDYWKCIISHQIIKFIQNKNSYLQDSKFSYRDQIIQKIDSFSSAHPQSKKQLKNLFIDGIYLDLSIFHQGRIAQGKSKSRKITFCPTMFTTCQMFQKFKKSQDFYKQNNPIQSKILISGSYGFSKTFSTVLYKTLTDYIVSYRLKYPVPEMILPEQILHRPKVIYCSLDNQQLKKYYNSKSLNFIKQNCKQIYPFIEKQKQYSTWVNDYSMILKYYQSRHINLCLIVDQINTIPSILRRKQQQNSIIQQQEQLLTNLWKSFIFFRVKIQQILQYFSQNIYLSSINIESNLWREIDITGTQKHSQMTIHQIRYLKEINKIKNMQQIVDLFIFLFGQKIHTNIKGNVEWHKRTDQNSMKNKQKLKEALFNIINQQKGFFYINLVAIVKRLSKVEVLQNNSQINPFKFENQQGDYIDLLEQKLIEYFKSCIDYSFQDFNERIQNFIKKDKHSKIPLKILSKIYLKAEQFIIHKQSNPQAAIQLSTDHFSQSQVQFLKLNIGRNTEKQLFEIKIYQRKIIVFGSAGFIYEVLKKYQNQIQPTILSQYKQIVNIYSPGALGTTFQYYFIQFIQLKNAKIQFEIQGATETFCFYDQSYYPFQSIPKHYERKKNQKYSLLKQIKKYFKIVAQKPQQLFENYTICLNPTKSKDQEYNNLINQPLRYSYSKAIDCIFIKKSKKKKDDKKIIEVWIIDNEISEKKSQIEEKKKKFHQEFIQFQQNVQDQKQDKNNNQIQLTYLAQKYQQQAQKKQQQITKYKFQNITQKFIIQMKYYVVGTQYNKRLIKETQYNKRLIKNSNQKQEQKDQKYIDLKKYPLLTSIGYVPIHNIKIQVSDSLLKINSDKRMKHLQMMEIIRRRQNLQNKKY